MSLVQVAVSPWDYRETTASQPNVRLLVEQEISAATVSECRLVAQLRWGDLVECVEAIDAIALIADPS